jgi:hypothetical protein
LLRDGRLNWVEGKGQVIRSAAIVAIYPVYVVYSVGQYALLQPTWPRRIGMFVTFLPVFTFVTLLWLGALMMIFGIIRALLGY